MKKRLWIVFLLAVLCICTAGLLSACEGNEETPNSEHQHTLVAVQGVAATCTEPGVLEHWRCETCDKLFSDKNGTAEIENATIPALGHEFVGGSCTRCGATDPNDDTLLDGKELKNVKISAQGILTWSRLKIASKYSVKISSAEGDHTFEVPKSEGSFDLAALPEDKKLRYGKNSVTLTAYQYQEEQIGGETIGDDVPVSSDSFLAVSKNGGYSLVRTTYADENLTITGAYSDVRKDANGNEYILIDKEIPQGNKDVSFNLSRSVKTAENVTVKYYKSIFDRTNGENAIDGFDWYTEVIKPGDNFYYLRVTCEDGSGKDYTVKVCGVRYVTFYFLSFDRSGKDEEGYNVYQYKSIGESAVLLENDYFDIDSLYALIGENKVIIDENRNVYEKGGDYMVPFSKSTAASASFSLFCADKTFIDAQKAEVELYKDLFELTYSGWTNGKGNQWLLRFKADSAETNLVVPSEIFGDRVVLSSDSFRNAANLQSVIFADGFTSLPDRLFANGCASLESVTIPASITSAYSLGDWMFSEDLKDQLTIYCEGDIESDTWNRVPGQMAFFRTYINQEGASSTVTVNGVRIKVDAAANEAEVLSASGENIVIPDTVRFGAKYYPVTSVKENAAISAVSVFLGKNIESLGEGWITDTILSVEADAENPYFVTSNGILYEKDGWKFRFVPQSLTGSVAIPEGVTNIPAQCFENRSGITEILFPSSLLSVGEHAFYGCTGLRSVMLPENVSSVGFTAFGGCSGIETVTLPFVGAGADGTGATHFGYLFGAASYSEQNRYLPQTLTQVTFTGDQLYDYAFYGCTTIAEVRLPNELTRIPNYAFYGCTSLVSVEIPDNVDAIGSYAFSGCSGLETFVYRGDGRIDDRAFENCVKLAEIVIPNATSVYSSAFTGCAELRIAEWSADAINTLPTSVEILTVTKGALGFEALEGHTALKEVLLLEGVTEIGIYAFRDCANLKTLELREGLISVGAYAFQGSGLTSISLPDSVRDIRSQAFSGCAGLTEVLLSSDNPNYWGDGKCIIRTSDDLLIYAVPQQRLVLPEGVKGIVSLDEEIGAVLQELSLPKSLEQMDASVFANCPDLESIAVSEQNPNFFAEGGRLIQKGTKVVVLGDSGVTEIPVGSSAIGSYAFSGRNIISIQISDEVQDIGDFAFSSCSQLEEVTLPNNLLSVGDGVFSGCDNLNYTKQDNGNYLGSEENPYLLLVSVDQTAETFEMQGFTRFLDSSAFNSSVLKHIIIRDNAGLVLNGNVFSNCRALESLVIGNGIETNLDPSMQNLVNLKTLSIGDGVTNIKANTFFSLPSLTEVTIGKGYTRVEDGTFKGCASLVTVNLSDEVEEIGDEAFAETGIYQFVIPASVTELGEQAFSDCNSLRKIEISGKITYIGYRTFWSCDSLMEIVIPDSVSSIATEAFQDCGSLVKVTLGSGVMDINLWAFDGCTRLTEVYNRSILEITKGSEEHGQVAYYAQNVYTPTSGGSKLTVTEDGFVFYEDGETVSLVSYVGKETDLVLPNDCNGKSYAVGEKAFYGNASLQSIVISDGVTDIGVSAFENCTSLKSVTIGGSVAKLGIRAFSGCTLLTDLMLGNGVTKIGESAFSLCFSLRTAVLPDSVTTVGKDAFWFCSSLTSVTLGSNLRTIGEMAFYDCENLIEVYNRTPLPIRAGSQEYGGVAQYAQNVYKPTSGESKLTETEDGFVFYEDGETVYLMYYTGSDAELTLPADFNGKNYAIFDYAFSRCGFITSVVISEGVTSIGEYAFSECGSLKSITISSSVTTIGSRAFSQCGELQKIEFFGTESQWWSLEKGYAWDEGLGDYTVIFTEQ